MGAVVHRWVVGAVVHRWVVGAVVVAGSGHRVRWSVGCGRGSVVVCFLQTAFDGKLQQLFISQVTVQRIIIQGWSGSCGSRLGDAGCCHHGAGDGQILINMHIQPFAVAEL